MKKLFFIFSLIYIFSFSHSKTNNFGIGVIAGEPTGLTLKYWLDNNSGFDLAIAWSFEKEASFRIHADYLWHFKGIFKNEIKNLFPYLGGGWLVNISERLRIGIRIPLGIEYMFDKIPLEVFLEIAPVINLIPATTLGGNAGLGLRYYF